MKQIGKVLATEKAPTTVDQFHFWTNTDLIIKPFDVIKVSHVKDSVTFGVVEEIAHLTDNPSFIAGYISSDFGDVEYKSNYERIGMNYVTAKVVCNSKGIYTPVKDSSPVCLATQSDIMEALGLKDIKNQLPCGYIEMYEEPDKVTIPVHFNSHFLIGPDGAHLNISGISGLAAKTSYAMFLLKSIQEKYVNRLEKDKEESVAIVLFNVKGRDLLAIDEHNDELEQKDRDIYELLGVSADPFKNVKYFYPYSDDKYSGTYGKDIVSHLEQDKAYMYGYTYDDDCDSIDLLFAKIDDPQNTMESIVTSISTKQSPFDSVTNWTDLLKEISEYKKPGNAAKGHDVQVQSWRKFSRIFNKTLLKSIIFRNSLSSNPADKEIRLRTAIQDIKKNDVFVIDIAKLDEDIQGFVFGDAVRAIYDLKLGKKDSSMESEIPTKILIFIDELNKYGSKDVPKNSPILRQLRDITERGRSLGIILFGAEQFRFDIDDKVKGNCATQAYGRTNAIEVSKSDYSFIPSVYKSMLTRLEQGEYLIQNPIFRTLLNIKFPNPAYRQFKNG